MQNKSSSHVVSYGTYVLIWLSLLILTVLTVTVAGIQLRGLAVVTALVIASTKTLLVLNFFMHLRYESWLLKIMVFAAVVTLAIFIGFTFFDVLFR
jgi:cytochrome c oxidase subunit 4